MARTQAVLPGGARLSDYLSVGVIAQIFRFTARLRTNVCDPVESPRFCKRLY
jgi:hypothetical protein